MAEVPGWLTVRQAADVLGISPESVYYLVREGKLADWTVGPIRLIDRADLERHHASVAHKQRPGPKPASGEGQP